VSKALKNNYQHQTGSDGYENHHIGMVEVCCCSRMLLLPAWDCMTVHCVWVSSIRRYLNGD